MICPALVLLLVAVVFFDFALLVLVIVVLRNMGPANLALAPPQAPQSCEAITLRVGTPSSPVAL
jgi:hypothetical protein